MEREISKKCNKVAFLSAFSYVQIAQNLLNML